MSDSKQDPLAQSVFIAAQSGDATAIKAIFSAIRKTNSKHSATSEAVAALANAVDSEGKTPLIHAAALGSRGREAVVALLAGRASPNCEQPPSQKTLRKFRLDFFSRRGKSVLCFAAEANATGSIQALLANGAALDKKSCDELGRQPLSIAAAGGFVHAASVLMSKGGKDLIWDLDHQGLGAVAHACSSGSADIVEMLLNASPGTPAQWLAPSAEGLSLMEHAAKYSNAECVELLASRIGTRDDLGAALLPRQLPRGRISASPLLIAAGRESFDVFHAILLESWWRISPADMSQCIAFPGASAEMRRSGSIAADMAAAMRTSALAKSARLGSWNEFSSLRAVLCDPHFKEKEFRDLLAQSCRLLFRNASEAIQMWSSAGFSQAPKLLAFPKEHPNGKAELGGAHGSIWDQANLFAMVNPQGQSLIAMAIERRQPGALKAILEIAHCLALTDPASEIGSEGPAGAAGGTLLTSQPKTYPWISAPGVVGLTPLARAASEGCRESCEVLLDFGASASAVDIHGWTPHMRAVQHGHVAVMSLLEQRDPAANLQDSRTFFGETPAMIASSCSQLEALSALCSTPGLLALRAAETRLDGTTALMLATSQSNLPCMGILLGASNVNAQNAKGATALAIACHDMSKDAVGLLAPLTDPRLADIDGMTPLIYAMWRCQLFPDGASCVDILSDFQNPRTFFNPSAKIKARFGDGLDEPFNASEWAEFLFQRVDGHQARNASQDFRKKCELWDDGLLPPRLAAPPKASAEPLVEMSALAQPLAIKSASASALRQIAAIEGATAERFPRRANRS